MLERFCKVGNKCSYEHMTVSGDQNNSLEAKKIEVLKTNAKILQERMDDLEEGPKTLKKKL